MFLFTPVPLELADSLLKEASERLVVEGNPFTEAEATLWLYRNAAFAPTTELHNQTLYKLERAQILFPYRKGALWGWGKTRTENFLKRKQASGEILISQQPYIFKHKNKTTSETGITVLTVCSIRDMGRGQPKKQDSTQDTRRTQTSQQKAVPLVIKEEEKRRDLSSSLSHKNGGEALSTEQILEGLGGVLDKIKASSGPKTLKPLPKQD